MSRPFVDQQQATLFGDGSRPRERKPRERDLLFEALAFVCKINTSQLTASNRGMLNRALKEIRDVGATPEMVLHRAEVYRHKWSHVPTPGALARHWASLGVSPLAVRTIAPEPAHGVTAERRREIAERLRAWSASR